MEVETFVTNASKQSYIYHNKGLSFQDANEHCRTIHDGRLAIADNDQTLNDLFTGYRQLNVRYSYYRIGLKQQNGLLSWIDGSRFVNHRRIIITSEATESCKGFAIGFIAKQSPSELNFRVANCSYPLPYICEKSFSMETFTEKSFANSISTPTVETQQVEVTDMTTFVTNSMPNTRLINLYSVLLPCIAAILLVSGLIAFCGFLHKKHSIKMKTISLSRVITKHNCLLFNHKPQLFLIGIDSCIIAVQ